MSPFVEEMDNGDGQDEIRPAPEPQRPRLQEVLDTAIQAQIQPPLLPSRDQRVERGMQLLRTLAQGESVDLPSADYEDVMLAARQRGNEFGKQLQWDSPFSIVFRGRKIRKQQD